MKTFHKPVVLSLSAVSLVAVLLAGCAESTEQHIEQKTDSAIAGTADAMNTVATGVKNVSTNVAAHVVDFSTNAWDKTKQGARKVVEVTTNTVNDMK